MSNKEENKIAFDTKEQELRRKKLKLILDKYFFSIASLAEKINISRGNLSTLLSGARPFSSYTASKIEASLALPHGYLSSDMESDLELSDFVNVRYYENVKYLVGASFEKKVKIPIEIANKLKIAQNDNILITYMNDESMYPTIKLNDMIIVDLSQNQVEDNMIYLIDIGGYYKVRRLTISENIVSVHIDNQEKKKTYIVNSFNLKNIKVLGKLVGVISDIN